MDTNGLPLILGPVLFQGFELPARIPLGGTQRLAIHRLADGSRVIDVLGPDDANIGWSATLAGPLAPARARMLDALRRAGQRLALSFGEWSANVIVSAFTAEANVAGWIPYRIACTVTADPLAADPVELALATLSSPGDPGPAAGLDAPDLPTILAAAQALAQAAAVRSTP